MLRCGGLIALETTDPHQLALQKELHGTPKENHPLLIVLDRIDFLRRSKD